MKKASLTSNFIYQFIYRLLTVLTPLITSPYLSRVLGPDNLGVYSATYAYANYFLLFAMLGVEFFGNRTIAAHSSKLNEVKQEFWNIYSIQCVAGAVSVLTYYISIIMIGGTRFYIGLIQGLWVIASAVDINWFFFGRQQFRLTVTRNIIIKIATLVLIFTVVKETGDLPKYAFIMSSGMLLSQIVMWYFLKKEIGFCRPQFDTVKKYIIPILKLFIPVLAMSVFHIMDKTMVDMLSNVTNGGCYYNTDRLINIPLGVVTGLNTVMLPRIAKDLHEGDKNIRALLEKSAELTLFIASAIAFGLGAIAEVFVPVFFGPGFELCIVLIEIFVPIVLIKSCSDYIRQQYLIPAEKDRLYIVAVSIGAVINFFANYVLITRYGAVGAVIGTLIAEAVVLIIQLVGLKGEINFLRVFSRKSIYVGFGIIMFMIVRISAEHLYYSGITNLIILIGIGGAVYMFCCSIYWIVNKKSIFHNIWRLLKNE